MAAPLNVHDINRLRASANQNATLADCWGQETVALIALEWAPEGYRYTWTSHIACNEVRGRWYPTKIMPVLTADVATFPRGWGRSGHLTFDRHRFWIDKKWSSTWRDSDGAPGGPVEAFSGQIRTALAKFFSKLQRTYTTVCVCSHRPQLTRRGLEEIGFSLPEGVPFVDLIRVMEYQTRSGGGVPKELSDHFGHWLEPDARTGGFDEVSGTPDGFMEDAPKWGRKDEKIDRVRAPGDIAVSTVLEVLGPEAEAHRRDIDKLERGNIAMERISRRAGTGKRGGKKRPKREARDLTGGFED